MVNMFLLAGDKFTPEMHLRQPGFTYSACGPFTKNKERIRKLKNTRDSMMVRLWEKYLSKRSLLKYTCS